MPLGYHHDEGRPFARSWIFKGFRFALSHGSHEHDQDENGKLQFLRYSILTGAFKFDPKYHQTLPNPLLDSFKAYIRFISDLVIIGYGFGDSHINLVIRDWIEMNKERRIVIVDPYRKKLPGFLLHVSPQVSMVPKTGREYFGSAG